MTKFLLHIFLSCLLVLVSLASAHYHEHSDTISISNSSDNNAHCDLCAMKSTLQGCESPLQVKVIHLIPERVSFELSFSPHFIFHFSPRLPLRAPPCTIISLLQS